ncbi:g protein-coupled receptor [Anaeramoeba ignava]|uniref:G protein-coupled receptor n=1 Tax=Anaeramoeba ignava TaxID=1746090 RepID=A0A9Q0L8K7_ANAIG|nr:g protein-coupled receptor [Anaeramoeba ignava]
MSDKSYEALTITSGTLAINLFRKLIFILSIFDFLLSLSFSLPGSKNSTICSVQVVGNAVMLTATPSWTASVSFITFLKIVFNTRDSFCNYLQKKLLIFTVILSTIVCVIWIVFVSPQKGGSYWCYPKEAFLIWTIYSIWWFFLVIILIIYVLCIRKIRINKSVSNIARDSEKRKKKEKLRIQLRMTLIPLVYLVLALPSTINRVRSLVEPNVSSSKTLDVLQAWFLPSQGIWDFLIFIVFVKSIRHQIISSLKRKCFKENSDSSTVDHILLDEDNVDHSKVTRNFSKYKMTDLENFTESEDSKSGLDFQENENENQNENQIENEHQIEENQKIHLNLKLNLKKNSFKK